MTQLTLSEVLKLNGVESWKLNQEEQNFLIRSTTNLVQRHGKDWVVDNQKYLQESLQEALKLL